MKKFTILLSVILLAISTSMAQDPTFGESNETNTYGEGSMSPGRWYLGGMLGLTVRTEKHEDGSTTTEGPKFTSFDIIPSVGYVLSDKWALGLGVGYESFSIKSTETDSDGNEVELKDQAGQFVIMPRVGYYTQLTNNLYCMPYFYIGFGFGTTKTESLEFDGSINTQEGKISSFEVGIAPSLKYFFSNYWAISLSYGRLFYENTTTTPDKDDSDHTNKTANYGLDLDLSSINLGLYYFF